jgi:hypothetical protein
MRQAQRLLNGSKQYETKGGPRLMWKPFNRRTVEKIEREVVNIPSAAAYEGFGQRSTWEGGIASRPAKRRCACG